MPKIPKWKVENMRASIAPLDTDERRQAYREGRFINSDKVKDLDRRYRWDLWWDSDNHGWVGLSADVTDAHIDTALRAIVAPLWPITVEAPL